MYWIKRKLRQIKKVWRYLPVIWKSYDFDHSYATDLFVMKLEDLASFLESDSAFTVEAKNRAAEIREAVALYKKVQKDDYFANNKKALIEEFGQELDIIFDKLEGVDLYELTYDFPESWSSGKRENYRQRVAQLARKSFDEQEADRKEFWRMISDKIEGWWD